MQYGVDFQRSVLKLMMQDHRFNQRCCELLKPSNFSGTLSWFFSQIREHFETYAVMATVESLSSDIAKHDIKKQQIYDEELTKIKTASVYPMQIKSKMTAFIRASRFVEMMKTGAYKYKGNDIAKQEESYSFIHDEVNKIVKITFDEDKFSRFGNAKDVIARAQAEKDNAIPTGIYVIDDAMGGGMLPGTLTTFLGPSNTGKSMLWPNIGFAAITSALAAGRKIKILVTVHEDEENPTKLRWLSRFSGIPVNKLTYGYSTLTDQEKASLEYADKLLAEHVALRFMYTTEASIEAVMDMARAYHRDEGLDLLLCDYGQCLTSREAKSLGLNDKRHVHGHVYHMLKQLGLELNIPVATAAQVNRNGMNMNRAGADWLRMTDVSEAIDIVLKSSNFITMNRSEEDKAMNSITFLLDKVRNGRCPVAVRCDTDYERATTHKSDPLSQSEVEIKAGPGVEKDKKDEPKKDNGPKQAEG